MKINNKVMLFLLLFFIIIGLSAVSAENIQDDTKISSDITESVDIADDSIGDNNIIKTTEKHAQKEDSSSSVSDYASLSDKINQIKEDTENDEYTIELEDGNYEVTAPITWGSTKKVKTLTINGNNQIIKGNSNQFLTVSKGYTLNLNNIVITGCENTKDGGAIINKGTLNLDTVTLENNKANFGGAIYNTKDLAITDSKFINNSAVNGGALTNTNYANAQIYDTIFESNTAENLGGAIENEHYSNMAIYNTTFRYNSAVNGGAIDDNQATLILIENRFDENNATEYAGAIYARLFANVTMNNSNLTNNYAGDDGGAIYNYFNSTFIGNNNIITNNKALMYGAAIYNDESELIFTENEISNNEVITYGGGAVYNTNSGFGHFFNNHFANNIAKTNGGVVYVSASKLEFVGNIVENNVARQSGALHLIQYCTVNVTDNVFRNNTASTNGGAIYTNSLILMNIIGNTISDNKAADGAALFSTGGNVLFDSNIVSNNVATTAGKKVVSNTGTLVSTNNVFTNNTDGTDMLMSETGTNTVSDNTYTANKLETTIKQVPDQPLADFDLRINISPKDVYNTTVDSGNILVKLNGADYYSGAIADSSLVTIKLDDLQDENLVEVEYTPINDDFQASTMKFNMKSSNEITVTDYESLYNTIENIKQDTTFDEFIINLGEGSYEVTTPIEWTDSVNAKTLTINGNGQEIKGNGKNFMIIDEDYNVDLYDMTISGCESNEDGGAIINDGCLNLINVTFKDNKANFGGAIVSHHLISIQDSLFINNFASNGGALANTNYASAGIYNTIFQENSAVTMAGAIYNEHQSTMIIDNCTFTANTANNGGAIDNDQATLSVENSLFEENVCLDYAGAIYNRYYAKLTVKNNTFRHNQAIEDEGGVFYNYFKSTLIAENNEFRNNYAWNYGGIIFNDDSEATFTSNYIFNSTVGKFGGSVIYNANGAHATFEDNLIFNNTAITNGGAVYTASSDIDLIDNIFFGNKARQGGTLYFIGANTNNVINNYIIDSVAETNGGAIYNTANQPLTVMGNIIENNVAGQGAALYSTGEVIFIQNNVTDNTVTNPSSKVIYNTGKFTANANIFTNNTDGNDILMSESGTNTVNDNIYKANMLETSITPSEDLNISSNYNLEVNVNVKEVYNYIVNSGNIVVKVNDVEYATEAVVDGKATVTLKADDLEDENNVVVEYRSEGTDFQESYIEFTVFTLAKKDTMIIINPIEDVAYNDNISITGQFLNEDLKPLIKSNLRLIINGVTNSIKTDNKGMFEFTYTAVTTGENNLTVKYVGNSKYNACSNTTQFVVNKKDTAIIIDEISNTKINEIVEITGKFINADGSVLRNSNVKIIINGISTNVKTDNKGVFKLNYTANTTGEITVTVSYKGNSKYNGCEESVQFTVDKKDTKITVNKINDVNKGEQVTITGKFTNEDNKALVNSNVVVYIGEAHYTVKTNNKGIFTYSFTPKIVGLNEIMVAYMGNAKYNRFNTTTTFNVLDE